MRRRNVKNAHDRLMEASNIFVINHFIYKGKWQTLFANDNPLHVEIGMGKGDFIIELARKNPTINYIGIEKYESVLVQATKKLESMSLPNLHLVCADAAKLTDIFEQGELSKLYLNFSDPWPKKRHEKRRLTSKNFLDIYKFICKSPFEIEFKTDNQGLFEYSLMSLNNNSFEFRELCFDLHKAKVDIVMTEYEKKFHAMGHPIYYVKVISGGKE